MKMRVCEYNENVIGIRIAHIDFYQDKDGIVLCPFTKGEVVFADALVSMSKEVSRLREALTTVRQYIDEDRLGTAREWIDAALTPPETEK